MMDVLELHRGEEKVWAVSISEDDAPADLSDHTVSVGLWWAGARQAELTEGAGVEIVDLHPPIPAEGEEPVEQFRFRVGEALSESMPLGQVASARIVITGPDGVTIVRGPFSFRVLR